MKSQLPLRRSKRFWKITHESLPKDFDNEVLEFWDRYRTWIHEPSREGVRRPHWPLSFIQLMQAASFLARGGKE